MWSLIRLKGLFGIVFSPYYFYGSFGATPLRWGQGAVPLRGLKALPQVHSLSQYKVGLNAPVEFFGGNFLEAKNNLIL